MRRQAGLFQRGFGRPVYFIPIQLCDSRHSANQTRTENLKKAMISYEGKFKSKGFEQAAAL